jgi:hypothetical protein
VTGGGFDSLGASLLLHGRLGGLCCVYQVGSLGLPVPAIANLLLAPVIYLEVFYIPVYTFFLLAFSSLSHLEVQNSVAFMRA